MGKINNNQPQNLSIPIQGMTCASCVARIEKTLRATKGVQEANVNIATEKANILYDPGLVDPQSLIRAIEDLGYGVIQEPGKTEKVSIAIGSAK